VPRVDDGPGGKKPLTSFTFFGNRNGSGCSSEPGPPIHLECVPVFLLTPGMHHPVVGCTVARFEEHHPCLDFVPLVFITAAKAINHFLDRSLHCSTACLPALAAAH